MPAGKVNTSGSLNGGVVNQPRSFSQMTGGLRHSSIVVQMEKVVDLAEQLVGRVPGEHVGQPWFHAHPHQRELARLLPLGR
jgi:hypothetical protein